MTHTMIQLSPCCGFYPREVDDVVVCGSCLVPIPSDGERCDWCGDDTDCTDECDCPACEVERALADDADGYAERCAL